MQKKWMKFDQIYKSCFPPFLSLLPFTKKNDFFEKLNQNSLVMK